jgi:hypothetical protein
MQLVVKAKLTAVLLVAVTVMACVVVAPPPGLIVGVRERGGP